MFDVAEKSFACPSASVQTEKHARERRDRTAYTDEENPRPTPAMRQPILRFESRGASFPPPLAYHAVSVRNAKGSACLSDGRRPERTFGGKRLGGVSGKDQAGPKQTLRIMKTNEANAVFRTALPSKICGTPNHEHDDEATRSSTVRKFDDRF